MINSILQTSGINYTTVSQTRPLQKKQKYVDTSSHNDKFNGKDVKKNIENAKNNGSLTYTEPTNVFGLTLRDGFYTYYPQKSETIGEIKQKFGISDNVISSMNFIYDDDYCPAFDNKPVYFKLEK